jgi:ATP-dependent Lon protease
MLAAHRAGIKTVLVPKENLRDLETLPEHVRKDIDIVPVESMDDVLGRALVRECGPKVAKRKPAAMKAPSQRRTAAEAR